MPVYNEGAHIADYLGDIATNLSDLRFVFVLVNDCSTDATRQVLESASAKYPIKLVNNNANLGHGPSTILGLNEALSIQAKTVIASDSDGIVSGSEIRRLYTYAMNNSSHVVEGTRIGRSDPKFRFVVSFITRQILNLLGAGKVRDANTPIRAYDPRALDEILKYVPKLSKVPNLMSTLVTRRLKMNILEFQMYCRFNNGGEVQGTSWRARFKALPSRRFIQFCLTATIDLIRFRFRLRKSKSFFSRVETS